MKKVLLIALAVSLLVAGMAMATVVSSKHDLRSSIPASLGGTRAQNYTSQVCVFCHHPHRGQGTGVIQNALLWNVSNDLSSANFTTYSSSTTNATNMGGVMGTDGQNITKACLSCHDGTIGIGSVVKTPADGASLTPGSTMPAAAQLDGTTFEDDHPVDFDYPTTANGVGLEDIQISADGGVTVAGGSGATYPLVNGRMQCNTCHNVHDPGSGSIQFLRASVVDSVMCRDCHTSK